jgi:hypothetical protein
MHIYVVSRLYKKEPTRWESILRELEQSRAIMRKHYAPLRNAIVAELKNAGRGEKVLRDGIAARDQAGKQQAVFTRSKDALANFIQRIRPKLGELKENFLGVSALPPVPFGGAELEGQFHLAATDETGATRYLFLHPSAWDGDEVASYIELLTTIGEARHGCSREDVWFVNLSQGEIQKPAKSYKRLRAELQKTVSLFDRLQRALKEKY